MGLFGDPNQPLLDFIFDRIHIIVECNLYSCKRPATKPLRREHTNNHSSLESWFEVIGLNCVNSQVSSLFHYSNQTMILTLTCLSTGYEDYDSEFVLDADEHK